MTKKLLAIGGPLHGKWLPDFGMNVARFPTPLDSIKVDFNKKPTPEILEVKTVTYIKTRLGLLIANQPWYKEVYYHSESIASYDVVEAVKDLLLETFMQMDNSDDD